MPKITYISEGRNEGNDYEVTMECGHITLHDRPAGSVGDTKHCYVCGQRRCPDTCNCVPEEQES